MLEKSKIAKNLNRKRAGFFENKKRVQTSRKLMRRRVTRGGGGRGE
jgi:hypothetical protein